MDHNPQQPGGHRSFVDDITEAAKALADPHPHFEPRWEWDANRNKKPLPPYRTTVPSLIQQLRDAAEPGVDGEAGGTGGAESCPVAIDAVSLLASIELGAAMRVRACGLTIRLQAEDNVRALIDAANHLPSRPDDDHPDQPSQWALRAELRSWQHQAEVITGWKTPARALFAPCMECGARGTVLARVGPEAQQAICVACDTRWDGEAEMAVLGRHERQHRGQTETAARAARTAAVAERRRREGHLPAEGHVEQGRTAA